MSASTEAGKGPADEPASAPITLVPDCPRCDIAAAAVRAMNLRFYAQVRLLLALISIAGVVILAAVVGVDSVPLAVPFAVLLLSGIVLVALGARQWWLRARAQMDQTRQMIRMQLAAHHDDLSAIRHDHLVLGREVICDGCLADLLGEPGRAPHAHESSR